MNTYENMATQVLLMFFMFCPAVAAFFTIKITKEDIRLNGEESLKLGLSLRGSKKWWLLLGIIFPLIYTELGYAFYYVLFPKAYDLSLIETVAEAFGVQQNLLWLIPFYYVVNSIVLSFAGLGEEIGWRSYLYPRLEKAMGEGKAVIIGGIIWSAWHFPMIYMGHNFGTDYIGAPWTGFLVFTVYCIAVGWIFYFFTKKTGSVWVAAFMHEIHNTVGSVSILRMMLTRNGVPDWAQESTVELLIVSVPMFVLGIVLWICTRAKNKKRKITS